MNRKKQGFSPPFDSWIENEKIKKFLKNELYIIKDFDAKLYDFYKEKVLTEDKGIYKRPRQILFMFMIWYKKNIEKIKIDFN